MADDESRNKTQFIDRNVYLTQAKRFRYKLKNLNISFSKTKKNIRVHYLLPPYSQNGTLPSFWAKYGGLNEYLYSNLRYPVLARALHIRKLKTRRNLK